MREEIAKAVKGLGPKPFTTAHFRPPQPNTSQEVSITDYDSSIQDCRQAPGSGYAPESSIEETEAFNLFPIPLNTSPKKRKRTVSNFIFINQEVNFIVFHNYVYASHRRLQKLSPRNLKLEKDQAWEKEASRKEINVIKEKLRYETRTLNKINLL